MPSFSLGRRRFTLGAVMAAAGALIRPGNADGQASSTGTSQPSPGATPPSGSIDQQAQAAMAKLSPQARAEVEMKVANLLRKYGERLSTEQKADMRKVMADTQEGLEKVRAFALDNADEPATVFHPYHSEGNH